MPLATLLLPPALLAVAGGLSWGLDLAGVRAGRHLVAGAAWLALLVLAGGWFAGGRTPVELATPVTAGVSRLVLRLDAVVVLFELVALAGVTPLLTVQRRGPGEAGLAALTTAAALAALTAGSLVLSAFGLAATATLALVLLRQREPAATRRFWLSLTAAGLLLAWAAALIEVGGGTSAYGAIPVTALRVPVFAVLALAALLATGLLPWRTWVVDVLTRCAPESGSVVVALLLPLGIYPLARAYGMGAGQWPSPAVNLALSAVGAATALAAATRAQAAASRRAHLAEAAPLAAGLALLALGLGTPLGLVAGLTALLGLALVAGLAPLVPAGRGPVPLLGLAVLAGAPPAIVFGGWLLSVQAAVEQGQISAFLGLAGAGAWLLGLAAAARGLRLPAGEEPDAATSRAGTVALAGAGMAAGVALTALVALLAIPAASELMPSPNGPTGSPGILPASILTADSLALSTAAGGWAAVSLGVPLVLAGLGSVALLRLLAARRPGVPVRVVTLEAEPEPLFRLPLTGLPERALAALARVQLPEQYRSLFQPAAIERAMNAGQPWFWAVLTIGLAIAVTR
jgi:formate hydrogenlyase subunit 3/multisubunit Na+/H+ antiporter MnhD subunit